MLKIVDFEYMALTPVPFARARSKGAQRFNDPKYSAYKKSLANRLKGTYARIAEATPRKGDPDRAKYIAENKYFLSLLIFAPQDNSDNDNYLKTVCDALQDSHVIADDRQIRGSFSFTLIDSKKPRILMCLFPIPNSQQGPLGMLNIAFGFYEFLKEKFA